MLHATPRWRRLLQRKAAVEPTAQPSPLRAVGAALAPAGGLNPKLVIRNKPRRSDELSFALVLARRAGAVSFYLDSTHNRILTTVLFTISAMHTSTATIRWQAD